MQTLILMPPPINKLIPIKGSMLILGINSAVNWGGKYFLLTYQALKSIGLEE